MSTRPVEKSEISTRRRRKILLRLGLVVLLSAAVAAAIVCPGCSEVAGYIAYILYGQLDQPIDREAAVTMASYPPSPDVRAVIGGKGEGLDCSIPPLLENLLFARKADVESPISLQFRQACVFHDNCYRHGYATYGYSQATCDFMLLQQAFRTCVQIYEYGHVLFEHSYAGAQTTEICQKRARQVLLGVRVGGPGSFKAREQSSYFEFDPMPIHADDYVVARLTNLDPDEELRLDGRRLLSAPTTFHLERSRVKIRRLQWNIETEKLGEGDRLSEIVFPDRALPTPPHAVRVGGRDWLVWLTRGKPFTTGFNALIIDPAHQGQPDTFRWLPCPQVPPSEKNPDTKPKCDFDSSVVRLIPPRDNVQDAVRFVAFAHRFADKTDDSNRIEKETIGLHWWDMPINALLKQPRTVAAPTPSPAKLENVSSHQYRFLQSEIHTGEFRKPGCSEVVALGRGIHLKPVGLEADKAKSNVGDDYEGMVAVAFIPFAKNCPKAESRPIALPQTAEPAVPVNKGVGTTDRLLTVSVGGNSAPVSISEYDFGGAVSARKQSMLRVEARDAHGVLIPLDSSWMKAAAYVVKPATQPPRSGGRGDRLLFSRAWLDTDQAKRFADGEDPDYIQLQFRYFDASPTGWTERAYSSCKIDLDKQHNIAPKFSLIRALYWRLAFEGVKTKDDKPKADELFKRLHKREMVRQWMQSQVIPGYIFAHEAPSDDHPIDVAVVFHGSADYSFLLEGVRGTVDTLDRFEVRRPAGKFAFVTCE